MRCTFAVCIVILREAALEAGRVLVGVQVSPTSGARRVHYCPALNLFVVYRRRAAKWYPILWCTPTVYVGAVAARGPLANATHVVTSRRPLSSRCNPGAPLRPGRFRLVRDEHGDMGSSNRVSLDTPRPGPLFNRVWSLPPGRWFHVLRRGNVLFYVPSHKMLFLRCDHKYVECWKMNMLHIYVCTYICGCARNISHFFRKIVQIHNIL